MRAHAADLNNNRIHRRQQTTAARSDLPDREFRPAVEAENRLHRRRIKNMILTHPQGTVTALFRRLKNQLDASHKFMAVGCQISRRSQQNRHVAIMAAGVHTPRPPTFPGNFGSFGHR